MKILLIILSLLVLVSGKSYAQFLSIDAKEDTTVMIPLSKSDCLPYNNLQYDYFYIPAQSPYFEIHMGYHNNCGTVDRMKVKISSDTIYLIPSDSGSLFTCICWREIFFVVHNYQYDTCTVIFGNLSAIYHNPMAGLNENAQNVNAILINNPFSDILQINISNVFDNNSYYSMELYTIDGWKIKTDNFSNPNNVLDTQSLKQGIYIAIVKKNGIVINIRKLIKV
jgi:hypothetical protein